MNIIHKHMNEVEDMHGKRLIDANALDDEVINFFLAITGNPKQTTVVRECKESFRKMIDEQPTIYANDGWIPVEERLPEEKINPITHDYYIYPVTFETEVVCDVRYYSFGKGHWWHGHECMDRYVTAWQTRPEQYKPEQPKPAKNTQQEMEDFWNDK